MKLKGPKTQWYGRVGFGLNPPQYVSLARFANSAEALFGLKSIAFTPGPFGAGRKLTLSKSSPGRVYELLASGGRILLGELKNDGTRKLMAAGMDTKADWERRL